MLIELLLYTFNNVVFINGQLVVQVIGSYINGIELL